MAINFITGNQNKFDEINLIVGNLEKLHIDLVEIQSLDAHLIIRSKLQEAFKHHPGPFIVEDTSLYLEGINGLPGPLIKWFLDTLKPDGIADLVEKIGNNRATAMTIIGYAEHQDNIQFFEGKLNGQIVRPRGSLDFGWGPTFQPDGQPHTFGEMLREEKMAVSMRGQAAWKLKEYLGKNL